MPRLAFCVAVFLLVSCQVHAYELRRLHPFAECTADQLLQHLEGPMGRLDLAGLRNDWVHKAFAVTVSPGEPEAGVTLGLTGDRELVGHVRLRVVGFVKQTPHGWVMDPIFDRPGDIDPAWGQYIRNVEGIRRFPTVLATPADPVVVWVTADTRGLKAGTYHGAVTAQPPGGPVRAVPLRLVVRPVELQADNPLICCGWQWIPEAPTKVEGARLFFDYGINATHVLADMEACREAGYRFFMFPFGPSWKGQAPEDAPEAEVDAAIAEVKATVRKLRLRPDQWALYTIDEPNDKSVPNQVRWCAYLRRKWPEVRFLFNPGWGPGPRNEWGTVAGTVEPLSPFVDIWLPYSHWLWDEVSGVSLPLMKKHARQVWFYEIMNFPYTRRPSVGRDMMRTRPWVAWKYGLQGCSWYSLNAISQLPYMDDPEGKEYAASYYTVPARSLEALREGFQEYKRMQELRRLGVDEATLNSFTDRALNATNVRDFDVLRRDMDRLLVALTEG